MALVLLGVAQYRSIQDAAVARAEQAGLRHQLDSLAKAEPKVLLKFVHDTLIVEHAVKVFTKLPPDTILAHLTDTVRVKEFVYEADTLIKACTSLVTTCEQRHQIDSATAADWKKLYQAEVKRQPSPLLGWGKIALSGVLGYAIGHNVK